MSLDDLIKFISLGASASIGMIFGILRSKIFSSKYSGTLHYAFIIFSILLFLGSIYGLFQIKDNIAAGNSYFQLVVILLSLVASIILFFVAKKFLPSRDIYKTHELDPIVNKFTSNADKKEIKLFGGDLNFFGNIPSEIDINSQYNHLRSLRFNKVLILCESPKGQIQQIRYGKILSDIAGAELRFYNPDIADLRVRGRIIQVDGVNKLLIYKKIKSKTYRAIETNTADSDGALYNNIWQLVWSLANSPTPDDIAIYKSLL